MKPVLRRTLPARELSRLGEAPPQLGAGPSTDGSSTAAQVLRCTTAIQPVQEIGADLFQKHYQHTKPPSTDLIQAIADVDDNYPFGPDNGIVDKFTPEMTKNSPLPAFSCSC